MFSNGTEAMMWMNRNCERCWKYNPEKELGKSICKIEEQVSIGFIDSGDSMTERTKKIIEKADCPYRQETRPVYKKRDKEPMTLFEGENNGI